LLGTNEGEKALEDDDPALPGVLLCRRNRSDTLEDDDDRDMDRATSFSAKDGLEPFSAEETACSAKVVADIADVEDEVEAPCEAVGSA